MLPDKGGNLDGEQEVGGILDQLALLLVGLACWLRMHHAGWEYVGVETDIKFGILGRKIKFRDNSLIV